VEKDVGLIEPDDAGDAIDAAYRSTYRSYSESIVSPEARAATLKLVPR
jgi:hypothetical protein